MSDTKRLSEKPEVRLSEDGTILIGAESYSVEDALAIARRLYELVFRSQVMADFEAITGDLDE